MARAGLWLKPGGFGPYSAHGKDIAGKPQPETETPAGQPPKSPEILPGVSLLNAAARKAS